MKFSRSCGRHKIVLEIFAGKSSWSRSMRRRGIGAIALDTVISNAHDVHRKFFWQIISGWIKNGSVSFVWMGTPCASWSRARHDLDGGGPRSARFILGKPGLSDADNYRVKIGNKTMNFSCRVIELCQTLEVPCALENPFTSFIWHAPRLVRAAQNNCTDVILDFCQFSQPWRKRTRVKVWNLSCVEAASRLCHGRHGICSASKKPHIVLKGRSKQGISWTKIAEPYPPQLTKLLSFHIMSGIDNLELSRKISRVA
jgi:hypothetical protein